MMIDNDDYIYEVIQNEADAFICAHLLAEEFTQHEPLTKFSRIGTKEFFDEVVWPSMLECLEDQVSILVRHCTTNEIVATILANDLYSAHKRHPFNPSDPPHKFALIDLISEMDEVFIQRDFGQELKPGMVLHIFVGATRSDHSGKGIATRLRTFLCDYACKTKGFQYCFVQATNPATLHIYVNKMGGKIVTEIDPTTWIWEKKDDGKSYPFKEFKGGCVPNILLKLI